MAYAPRDALAAMLFDDEEAAGGEALRSSVVQAPQRSPSAQRKAARKKTDDGLPVHSFQSLLGDLTTIVRSTCKPHIENAPTFEKVTIATALQQRAFDLLHVSPNV